MSTKAEIQTQINTIATGVLNPATTVRAVLGTESASILENFYGLKTGDTNGSVNVVTQSASNIAYVISTIKQGFRVSQNGNIINSTGSVTPTNTLLFTITNSEYFQQSATSLRADATSSLTGENIRLRLTGNALYSQDPIGIGETIIFNLGYNTQS